jgi:hypothetical protein
LASTPGGVPTTPAAASSTALRRVAGSRSCPDTANAIVPATPAPMFVAIAVPATAAGTSGVSANSPIVGSTPPGPTALMPTPPTRPITASATSTSGDRPLTMPTLGMTE